MHYESTGSAMIDQDKSKQELIEELAEMRRREAQWRSVVAERDRDRAILSAAIECLPFEFFAIGTDGRYMLQNAVSRQHAGDAIGKRPEDCAPDEYTRQLWLDNNRRAFAGERVEGEVEAHVGGETRTFYNIISPIRDDGKVCGILGVNVDITERKRAEEALRLSEEHHRVLKETMLQGVVHHDAEGTIIAMNPAAEHILGKTREQFLGSSSTGEEHDTIREDGSLFPGVEHPAMVALQTGQPVTGVVMGVFNPKVGDYRWISIDAVPLFRPGENRPYQVYAVFEDITERKRAEEALQKAHDELEQRVKERTAELAKANENLDIFRKFAEDSGEGFGMSDFDGRIVYANPTLCRLFGEEKPEDVIGKNVSAYYPEEYVQRRKDELIPALLREGHWHIEQTVLPRHGKPIQTFAKHLPDSGRKRESFSDCGCDKRHHRTQAGRGGIAAERRAVRIGGPRSRRWHLGLGYSHRQAVLLAAVGRSCSAIDEDDIGDSVDGLGQTSSSGRT